ncbi:inositol polyphosphate-4-phosphatase type I A-like [Halichondria panicea]|uniref:inositol polyphosphate-4-phosphatase type I A-like n=1 Tax=Halichondria panicea TaxID=6063 RepID=UPI00312B6723
MKFNQQELALFASSRQGKADKEGVLWLREIDGTKVKKKQGYAQRWFTLSGNMLFYSKSDLSDSGVVGVIILERCRVEPDNESGNRNSFKLAFDESEFGYLFTANSARDQDEWTTALNSSSYEYLRVLFSDLRGQLLHLTGKDPLVEDHPYFNEPIKNISPIPASAPAYEGEPVFELSLACSSLVGSLGDCVPSAMIVTSVMTPPQAYWIRYAQTEVVEHNCDPRFFTTVVFYMGSVAMATKLKFEIFDVYDRKETKVCPIGAAQCQVMDLLRSPDQSQRHEILFDRSTCGYLTVKATKSRESDGAQLVGGIYQPPLLRETHSPTLVTSGSQVCEDGVGRGGFNYQASMDNIVIRNFQFPVSGKPDQFLKVTEVMGEGKFSFSIPMQMLDLYIVEESHLLAHYNSINRLNQEWEINKQAVMVEHQRVVQHYRESKSGLQAQLEAGITFKKSTAKGSSDLDFVPVNLHIQQLKVVSEETDFKDKMVFSAVTVGCPTAYSLKFKAGGLAKLQNTHALVGLGGSGDTKSTRAKGVASRVETVNLSILRDLEQLVNLGRKMSTEGMERCVRVVADKVHQIKSHSNITLTNDALRALYAELAEKTIPIANLNVSSLFHKIEEHVYCVEAKVEALISPLVDISVNSRELIEAVGHLRTVLDEVVSLIIKALYFVILKESYFMMDKFPIGLRGLINRHDIVFSQALASVVTSFVVKLTQCLVVPSFLSQLVTVGFLVHWESLLSTMGDELGMLEDFITAIHDLNNVKFKLTLSDSLSDVPLVKGSRYKVIVEVPLQRALFRMLPPSVQEGQVITVCAVLFTQGINEQQTFADKFFDSSYQDQINMKSLQKLTSYCTRYHDHFGSANAKLHLKAIKANQLLEQLRTQVHTRKDKNVEILSLSADLCRTLDCGRVTSCKSAKDRTAMAVTLEQTRILLGMQMDPSCQQHTLDAMRSQGTRLRNTEKNVGVPLYAFNAIQVFTLPPLYRPPEGTYKKLQT